MKEVSTLKHIEALRESEDIECKLAQGRHGDGTLPKDVWETLSAFSNTEGGDIFLGLKELEAGNFELAGINDTHKVLREFWHGLNSGKKISPLVIEPCWVKVIEVDGKNVIQIHVPKAAKEYLPVYIHDSPFDGSYKRSGSSDVKIAEEEVRRMLDEARQ